MNYNKIIKQLEMNNLVDSGNFICHAFRKYTVTQDRVIYAKYMSIDNTDIYPSFMLLSLKGDKLNISFAKAFGGFKKYYASISLNKFNFQETFTLDKFIEVHFFYIEEENKKTPFYIIVNQGKDRARALVDEIKRRKNVIF